MNPDLAICSTLPPGVSAISQNYAPVARRNLQALMALVVAKQLQYAGDNVGARKIVAETATVRAKPASVLAAQPKCCDSR